MVQKSNPAAVDGVKLTESDVLEDAAATHGPLGETAVFDVYLACEPDWGGRFVEAESRGASIASS